MLIARKVMSLGSPSYIGPDVVVGSNVKFGQRVMLMRGVRIGNNVTIGNNVKIGMGAYGGPTVIHDWASLSDGCVIHSGCVVGPSETLPENTRLVISNPVEMGCLRKKKVAFICVEDCANVSTEYALAIRTHIPGWDARSICGWKHAFDYSLKHDWDWYPKETHKPWVHWLSDVDLVIWAQEDLMDCPYSFYTRNFMHKMFLENLHLRSTAKAWLIMHTGDIYRKNYHEYNAVDADEFDAQVCAMDLHRLALPGALTYIGKPISINLRLSLEFSRQKYANTADGEWVISHSPTDYVLKGTENVRKAMEKLTEEFPKVKYLEIGGPFKERKHIPQPEAVRLRNSSHIYIDQFYSPIGGFGVSSIEAMSAGVISLCTINNISPEVQNLAGLREPLPIIPLPNSENPESWLDLYRVLKTVITKPKEELLTKSLEGIAYVNKYFSPENVAKAFHTGILSKFVKS